MLPDLQQRCVLLFAVLSLTTAGCGAKPELAEVSGVVNLNGKPMAAALVEFLPDPEKGNHGPVSSATTDAEGRFRLVTSDQRDGARIGFHRVLIQDARSIPKARSDFSMEKPPENVPSRVPSSYSKAASTPLRDIEVKPGPQTLTLEVTSKTGR